MTYTKPEVAALGKASRLIENSQGAKQSAIPLDGVGLPAGSNPAYDLDE